MYSDQCQQQRHSYCFQISSTTDVVATVSLLLEIKFWPEMKTKEKRDNNSLSKEKQTKNITKKPP